jgi:hypothetical protein
MQLRVGDIFLTASPSLLGRVIRFFEARKDDPAEVNHSGLIVVSDRMYLQRANDEGGEGYPVWESARSTVLLTSALSIEALARVRVGDFRSFYGGDCKDRVAIYRDTTLTLCDMHTIHVTAMNYRNDLYGGGKLLLHLGDWCLTKLRNKETYVFRRLARMDKLPICSWIVAKAYAATGRNFGVPAGVASPDDIYDFIIKHPEKYTCIHHLERLGDA